MLHSNRAKLESSSSQVSLLFCSSVRFFIHHGWRNDCKYCSLLLVACKLQRKSTDHIFCNNSLWKRVISWGRSRAASGYGIIWGEAGQNKAGGIYCGMLWHGLQWWQQGFNRTTESNNIEVIVLDDQKSRELRRIRTTRSAIYLYDVV